jgi:peptidoglycan lytic transglycosylase G
MTQTEIEAVEPARTTRHRRRRRGRIVLVAVLLLALVGAAGGAVGYYNWCRGTGTERAPVTVRIPEGATGDDVVRILESEDVIRCGGIVGRLLIQRTGKFDAVRAGSYELETNMTLDAALRIITKAPEPAPTATLTIPEGYRLTQIADVVSDELGLPAARFLDLAESGEVSLPPYLPSGKPSAEGFLFPQTYEFATDGVRAKAVIRRLLRQFEDEVAGLAWGNARDLGLSRYEVVVVASLIEREAVIAQERPRIAAVIYNRLRDGEILGIDAAIQYIDPDPTDGLTESDLEIDSPYNTRINTGLPPTPIASPGLASLRAALEPLDTDEKYYVLCGEDGSHVFTDDFDQFQADVERCLD